MKTIKGVYFNLYLFKQKNIDIDINKWYSIDVQTRDLFKHLMRRECKVDIKGNVSQIIKLVGGKENVNSATHCVTRLRIILNDKKLVNFKELEKLEIVKGSLILVDNFK